jgi:hypothetical protein
MLPITVEGRQVADSFASFSAGVPHQSIDVVPALLRRQDSWHPARHRLAVIALPVFGFRKRADQKARMNRLLPPVRYTSKTSPFSGSDHP